MIAFLTLIVGFLAFTQTSQSKSNSVATGAGMNYGNASVSGGGSDLGGILQGIAAIGSDVAQGVAAYTSSNYSDPSYGPSADGSTNYYAPTDPTTTDVSDAMSAYMIL